MSGGRKITDFDVLGLQLVLMCELIAAAFPSTAVSRDCVLVMVAWNDTRTMPSVLSKSVTYSLLAVVDQA